MNVLLLQIDGKIPNLALMRIAAHHKAKGDTVELNRKSQFEAVLPEAGDLPIRPWDRFDRIYASTIFEKSRPTVERILACRPDTIVGGTGWDLKSSLEANGINGKATDYTIYPDYMRSIGFTQRGCRLACSFCVVPRKEGKMAEEATIGDIWRGDGWPKELLLLDNDFFGQPSWRDRIREIRDGGFKVSFNQGINARFLTDEAAEAIASVNYRDDQMEEKRIYTAWDNPKDEKILFSGLQRLIDHGVTPRSIMVYMLIGYWPGETHADRDDRRKKLRAFGCRPYPMPYVRTKELVGFQRWLVGAYDKPSKKWPDGVPWEIWEANDYQPRGLEPPKSPSPGEPEAKEKKP